MWTVALRDRPAGRALVSDPNPTSAAAVACPRRRQRLLRLQAGPDRGPDRRGEAFHIFTTIFVRPALELRDPIRRLVQDLAGRDRITRDVRLNPDRTRAARGAR